MKSAIRRFSSSTSTSGFRAQGLGKTVVGPHRSLFLLLNPSRMNSIPPFYIARVCFFFHFFIVSLIPSGKFPMIAGVAKDSKEASLKERVLKNP